MTEVEAVRLKKVAEGLGIGKIGRHIFLCADQTNPKCSGKEESAAAWENARAMWRAAPDAQRQAIAVGRWDAASRAWVWE